MIENDCAEVGGLTRPKDAGNTKLFALSLGQLLNLPDEIVSKCKISLNMKVTDENGNWVPAIDRYQKMAKLASDTTLIGVQANSVILQRMVKLFLLLLN